MLYTSGAQFSLGSEQSAPDPMHYLHGMGARYILGAAAFGLCPFSSGHSYGSSVRARSFPDPHPCALLCEPCALSPGPHCHSMCAGIHNIGGLFNVSFPWSVAYWGMGGMQLGHRAICHTTGQVGKGYTAMGS